MMRGISWLSTRRHALLVPALALTLLSLNVRRAVAAEPAVNGSNIDEMIWYTPYGYSKGDGYSGSWPPYYNASTGDYGFKVGSSYSLELYGLANTTWNIYLYHYNNKTRLKWDDYSQLNQSLYIEGDASDNRYGSQYVDFSWNWIANTGDMKLNKSTDLFYMTLYPKSNYTHDLNVTSGLFNISEADNQNSLTATKVEVTQVSTRVVTAGLGGDGTQTDLPSPLPQKSNTGTKVGLGVGLGLGIPILAALAFLIILMIKRGRLFPRSGADDSAPEPVNGHAAGGVVESTDEKQKALELPEPTPSYHSEYQKISPVNPDNQWSAELEGDPGVVAELDSRQHKGELETTDRAQAERGPLIERPEAETAANQQSRETS